MSSTYCGECALPVQRGALRCRWCNTPFRGPGATSTVTSSTTSVAVEGGGLNEEGGLVPLGITFRVGPAE